MSESNNREWLIHLRGVCLFMAAKYVLVNDFYTSWFVVRRLFEVA